MTRWHTDTPIGAISAIRPLDAPAAENLARSDRPAQASLKRTHAYFLEKLRRRKPAKPADPAKA